MLTKAYFSCVGVPNLLAMNCHTLPVLTVRIGQCNARGNLCMSLSSLYIQSHTRNHFNSEFCSVFEMKFVAI